MRSKLAMIICVALLMHENAQADTRCDTVMAASIHQTQILVDSIRIDKPGLARVYSSDRTEFTAGQARWMKAQMHEVEAACARDDRADAALRLAAVQELVRVQRRQNL